MLPVARLAAIGALCAAAGSARADVAATDDTVVQLADALANHRVVEAERLLAPQLVLDGLWFPPAQTAACGRFAKPQHLADADRDAFVRCLDALAVTSTTEHRGIAAGALLAADGLALGAAVRDRRVAELSFVDIDATDAKLPTVFRIAARAAQRLRPEAPLRAAVDARPSHRADTVYKVCLDRAGKPTRKRLIAASGLAAFDAAAHTIVDVFPYEPVELGGTPAEVCEVIRFAYDARAGASPTADPSTRAATVILAELEPTRTAGTPAARLAPDAGSRAAIKRAMASDLRGTWRACFDANGAFSTTELLHATGVAAFDQQIGAALRKWAFAPRAAPFCTLVQVAYSTPG